MAVCVYWQSYNEIYLGYGENIIMKKKTILIMLMTFLLLFCGAFICKAEIFSGSCGSSIVWTLDENGTLTFTGRGAIPDYDEGDPEWYQYKDRIYEIVINDGITHIGEYAFFMCSSVNLVSIPESVREICEGAFHYCTGIKQLTLPISARISDENWCSFLGCSNIEKIRLTKGSGIQQDFKVSAYKTSLYYGYTPWSESQHSLKEIIIDEGVSAIGAYAFYECKALKTIPESIVSFGTCSFYRCENLEGDIAINENANSIGTCCFYDCKKINTLTLPNTISSIGANAFYMITNLNYYGDISGSPWGARCLNGVSQDGLLYADDSLQILVGSFEKIEGILRIPEGVKEIRPYAFYDYDGITGVELPSTLEIIGDYAFYNCYKMLNVILPDSIQQVGAESFNMVGNLQYAGDTTILSFSHVRSINGFIENGIVYSDNQKIRIVATDSDIEDLFIQDSVEEFSANCYYGCTNLKNVHISSLQKWLSIKINSSPFLYAEKLYVGGEELKELLVPSDIEIIPMNCFYGMKYLNKIVLHDNVNTIEEGAFSYCSGLKELVMPISAIIGDYAFKGTFNIETITLTKGNGTVPDYNSNNGEYRTGHYTSTPWYISANHLNEIVLDNDITRLGDYFFYANRFLNHIDLPENLISIGRYAFVGCKSLKQINLPTTLNELGSYAFANSGIENIIIPDSITNPGKYTFHGSSIASISIPNTMHEIPDGFFSETHNLQELQIPDWITKIGSKAFYESSLEKLYLPNSIREIGDDAFSFGYSNEIIVYYNGTVRDCLDINISTNNNMLRNQILWQCTDASIYPGKAGYEDNGMFWYVDSEKTLHLEGGENIPDYSSANVVPWHACKNSFDNVIFSDNISRIGNYAFADCMIKTISMPESVTTIGTSAFQNCSSLKEVYLSNNLTDIGSYAFDGCNALNNILLPDGLLTIQVCTFRGSGITTITIPETTSINGNCAFQNCKNLISATIYGKLNSSNFSMFNGCEKLRSVTISKETKSYGNNAFNSCSSLNEIYYNGTILESLRVTFGTTGNDIISSTIWHCSDGDYYRDKGKICGSSVYWILDDDGTLTIHGKGSTYSYSENTSPFTSYADQITTVNFEGEITNILLYFFNGCTKLKDITLPFSLTNIGNKVFYNCSSLEKVVIPSSVNNITSPQYLFTGCDNLDSVIVECGSYAESVLKESLWPVKIVHCNLPIPIVAATHTQDGSYGGSVCNNCGVVLKEPLPISSSKCLWLPQSLAEIEDSTFEGASQIEQVWLSNSTTKIGENAFKGCKNLALIYIPDLVTEIGEGAFDGCANITFATATNSEVVRDYARRHNISVIEIW